MHVAHHGDGIAASLGIANFPVVAHLSKTAVAPRFSNKKEDWVSFANQFDKWLRILAQGKDLSDQESMLLLNSCLPENLQKEMELWERERNASPTYLEFRAHLEAKFALAQSDNMRRRWTNVEMPKHQGKITLQSFQDFMVNFKLAMADVPDTNPEDARRVLLDKIPPFMKAWVAEAELKKMRKKCMVELGCKPGMTSAMVVASVQNWTGSTPSRAEVRGGGTYWVLYEDERQAQKLLELNGRVGGSGIRIVARKVEQKLLINDIFAGICARMEMQERTAEYQRSAFTPRYAVHETQVESKKVAKGSSPKPVQLAGGGSEIL